MSKVCARYKNVAAILLLVAMLFVLAGCKDKKANTEDELRGWVEKLDNTFSDDHFEYERFYQNVLDGNGGYMDGMGTVVVKSEKYPDQKIYISNNFNSEGEPPYTNYNSIRYKEDMEEYIKGVFEEHFSCDSCEVQYLCEPTTPIEYMSFNTYLQKYARFSHVDVIIYKKDGAFTAQEQTVDELIRIVKERNEVCKITLYYCTEESADPFQNYDYCYKLHMEERHEIRVITVESPGSDEPETLVENRTW
ncbi:MAG: hypothetical protein J5636_12025 [Clostridiales bacterium]|nr:hypothetical protein [Clostridiales bacterium]